MSNFHLFKDTRKPKSEFLHLSFVQEVKMSHGSSWMKRYVCLSCLVVVVVLLEKRKEKEEKEEEKRRKREERKEKLTGNM